MAAKTISLIGVPTNAGAYRPRQEKTPDALRRSGLVKFLKDNDIDVVDKGNLSGFRWKPDKTNVRAMDITHVSDIALAVSEKVNDSLNSNEKMTYVQLVLY